MGAKSGSISYTLYHVDGDLPTGFVDAFLEKIREFAFSDLQPDQEEDSRDGWTVLDNLLDTNFEKQNVFLNEYICLGMRVDKWALPAALFRAKLKKREELYKQEQNKERLYKSEKLALRKEVTLELRKKTVPAASVVDMVWNTQEKTVRFWSQSGRMVERFENLFESTFELKLIPTSPYIEAIELQLAPEMVGILATAEPSRFTQFE